MEDEIKTGIAPARLDSHTWRGSGAAKTAKENANYYVVFRFRIRGSQQVYIQFIAPISHMVAPAIPTIDLLTKPP